MDAPQQNETAPPEIEPLFTQGPPVIDETSTVHVGFDPMQMILATKCNPIENQAMLEEVVKRIIEMDPTVKCQIKSKYFVAIVEVRPSRFRMTGKMECWW